MAKEEKPIDIAPTSRRNAVVIILLFILLNALPKPKSNWQFTRWSFGFPSTFAITDNAKRWFDSWHESHEFSFLALGSNLAIATSIAVLVYYVRGMLSQRRFALRSLCAVTFCAAVVAAVIPHVSTIGLEPNPSVIPLPKVRTSSPINDPEVESDDPIQKEIESFESKL